MHTPLYIQSLFILFSIWVSGHTGLNYFTSSAFNFHVPISQMNICNYIINWCPAKSTQRQLKVWCKLKWQTKQPNTTQHWNYTQSWTVLGHDRVETRRSGTLNSRHVFEIRVTFPTPWIRPGGRVPVLPVSWNVLIWLVPSSTTSKRICICLEPLKRNQAGESGTREVSRFCINFVHPAR